MAEPKSQKPKVAATGIAGVIAALAVWAWNNWQAGVLAKCITPDMGGGPCTDWRLEEPIGGVAIALVAWAAGPLIRKYEAWESNGSLSKAETAQAINKILERLDKMEKNDP